MGIVSYQFPQNLSLTLKIKMSYILLAQNKQREMYYSNSNKGDYLLSAS